MPVSRWIEFIKQRAKEQGKTYGCMLSDPETSKAYKKKYLDANEKKNIANERVNMGMEDIDAKNVSPKRKRVPRLVYKPVNPYEPKMKSTQNSNNLQVMSHNGENITMKAVKGRPQKYATAEEKALHKREQTLASNNRRYAEKKAAVNK